MIQKSVQFVKEAIEELKKVSGTKIIYSDNEVLAKIKYVFDKYKPLSITDCAQVVLSEKYSIKYIFSFEGDVDGVFSSFKFL